MVPFVASEHTERDEGPPCPVHVTQLAVDGETLFIQSSGLSIVSLLVGESTRRLQGLGSRSGTSLGGRQRQQRRHPLPSLGEVAAAAPEAAKRTAKAQAVIGRAMSDEPRERRAQIVMVLVQVIQPLGLPPPSLEARLRSFGELQVTVGMGQLEPIDFPSVAQTVQRVLANRFQHPKAQLTSPLLLAQETLVDQRGDAVDHVKAGI